MSKHASTRESFHLSAKERKKEGLGATDNTSKDNSAGDDKGEEVEMANEPSNAQDPVVETAQEVQA